MSVSSLEFIEHWDHDWQVFAESQKLSNIFHHAAWSGLLQECYGYRPFVVILRNAGGQISAGLPMMEVGALFSHRRWVSIPFSDHCAPLYSDPTALREFAEALTFEAQKSEIRKIQLRCELSAKFELQSSAQYVLHTIELNSALEEVKKRIHRSHLGSIKTAQARGVQTKFGRTLEDVRTFYSLHLESRHRQGVPIQPYHYFETLYKRLIEQGLGFVLLAYEKEQCLAGAIFLHWNHTLTYKYAASRSDPLHLCPNHLLLWNAIEWGCNHGFTRLDLGRTSIENMGLRSFKSRWGAEETPLLYTSLPHKSNQISNHLLLKVMGVVIQRSPSWVCRLSGELLYKHFG
jgi:CelD/BcsL family acetyltransferase involved in cellulose biosynthesis